MKNKNTSNSSKIMIVEGINGISKLKSGTTVVCNNGISGISKLDPKNISVTNNKNTNNTKK